MTSRRKLFAAIERRRFAFVDFTPRVLSKTSARLVRRRLAAAAFCFFGPRPLVTLPRQLPILLFFIITLPRLAFFPLPWTVFTSGAIPHIVIFMREVFIMTKKPTPKRRAILLDHKIVSTSLSQSEDPQSGQRNGRISRVHWHPQLLQTYQTHE